MPKCLIKFCGLRTPADVALAVELGVDAIGFVFADSPRQITVAECQALRAAVPVAIKVYGVFVRPEPAAARDIWRACRLDALQIHGAEADENYWRALADLPVVRAFRARPHILPLLAAMRGQVFLLDAFVAGEMGGTGQPCDWTLAAAAAKIGRLILAGGLTPENVGRAIAEVKPWMVDVSSGIERERGKKDPELMRAFVAAVRGQP
ncbi:MAG: phosphoribosylanthranilate isomerase [Planctomycetota bacterium]|nr:phosphoribosylanthranilate isomerase [Planctomycetota bacterium]